MSYKVQEALRRYRKTDKKVEKLLERIPKGLRALLKDTRLSYYNVTTGLVDLVGLRWFKLMLGWVLTILALS